MSLNIVCPHCRKTIDHLVLYATLVLEAGRDQLVKPPEAKQQQQQQPAPRGRREQTADKCQNEMCLHWRSAHRVNPGETPANYAGPCKVEGCGCQRFK